MRIPSPIRPSVAVLLAILLAAAAGCRNGKNHEPPTLSWYVFNEPSGAFSEAAGFCTKQSSGRYKITLLPLPPDADQQREQVARRLAASDRDIDIIGMDVIWTAEFAEAGWILAWPELPAKRVSLGRLPVSVESAHYRNRLWAAPLTGNVQLLWYRSDRVSVPPATWSELIEQAEALGQAGAIQVQGQRYEGLTVFFISLLASAGGQVLDASGGAVSLNSAPTRKTLALMKRLAMSPAADPALDTAREDQARLAFETGGPTFMINYPYVWPSAHRNAPEIASHMAFALLPAVEENRSGKAVLGGINLGIGAHSRYPKLALEAAECLASRPNQIRAAIKGGLPPTLDALYDDPEVRRRFPFADILRETLREAVLRPRSPLYNDVSLAIGRILHPLHELDPETDAIRLRQAVARALHSEGLL
ncbi:ABC transporter substrate-binding protein [Methylosarcina fibrata]|uniref:ABC transporter substrate-binding protein n=1 Tax=Methylosarcina fibrata TaxID=105972 RepID=UPI000369C081|nr:ABC transporter substrate-binding protein [Methylosarcina fibrata]